MVSHPLRIASSANSASSRSLNPQRSNRFIEPEDCNITSYVMEHHQRSGIGNSTIIHYLLNWFRLPTSFEHGSG